MNFDKSHSVFFTKRKQPILTHDLSFINFKKAVAKGSLSRPSIAISQFQSMNEDASDVGFLGNEAFGSIRLVMNPTSLLGDGYDLPDNIAVYNNDINSPMIPPIRYGVTLKGIKTSLNTLIGETALGASLISNLPNELDDLVSLDEFRSMFMLTPAVKLAYSVHVAKDGISDLIDTRSVLLALDKAAYGREVDKVDGFLTEILESSAAYKGMEIEGEFIRIDDMVSESELVDAFYEMYPPIKVGGLIQQHLDSNLFDDSPHLVEGIIPNMFATRLTTMDAIDAARERIENSAGFSQYVNKSNRQYKESLRGLSFSLSKQNPNIVAKAVASVCEKIDSGKSMDVNDIAEVLSDNGVMITIDIYDSLTRCVESKMRDSVTYFEMKMDSECSLANVNHIVVPSSLAMQVKELLNSCDLDCDVVSYEKGDSKMSAKWNRALLSIDAPSKDIALMDNQGFRLEATVSPRVTYAP